MSVSTTSLSNITQDDLPVLHAAIVGGQYGSDPADIANALAQRPMVPNPDPPAQLLKPLTISGLLATMSPAGQQAITSMTVAEMEPIAARVREGDRAGVIAWAEVLAARGTISPEDAQAVAAEAMATIDDPEHPDQVPGDSVLTTILGRRVGGISAAEVEAAMNYEGD